MADERKPVSDLENFLGEKLYSTDEVANLLGVTLRTVYRYIHDTKELEAFKVGGEWKITEEAIKKFLQGRLSNKTPNEGID